MTGFMTRWARSLAVRVIAALLLTGAVAGTASAASYVDSALGDLKPEERVAVAHPQPVQLLFEFQSNGAANPRATKFLKAQVHDIVRDSGLFSEVDDGPAPNGAVLSIAINNVIDQAAIKDASAKGFATGLTLGLAGTLVTDHYVCTVQYVGSQSAKAITKTANHAIHTTIGLKSAPPDGVKAANGKEAATIMTRQIVSHPLNELAGDPGFTGAEAAPAPAEALKPADAAPPAASPEAPPPPQPAPTEAAPPAQSALAPAQP